ncbi:MAG: hypothetical protein A2W98_06280 [Bacteroidetes bacterium GWF2_33_38]|nr:MAG: hypothetical protein A2W98_06280 [Bacteroidetes bacterium GWF2_33_38]OFY68632.1 MAG: hypothetical protein A2265_06610 [Bacteroidetes bacterium RIFOXYA12_FULL_33_9]OFY85979.1 MAG: hypothetical protein A2236_00785 [Bacteroidetes bacterium RIFOXYA2_FULL_33_7]
MSEIEIKASRSPITYYEKSRSLTIVDEKEIKALQATSIIDVLEYVGSLDVRQRGAAGVQADIGMRGSSNEQVLILVNGAKINDPQTGHHNMNIPIDVNDIKRIEILHGPGARIYGANAYSGAINIITGTSENKSVNASLSAGEYGLISGNASLNYNFGVLKNFVSVSKNICDGYIENTDFDINNLFYHSSIDFAKSKMEFQAGYNQKEFGANSFYTVKYPNQFEATKTTFVNARLLTGNKIKFKPGVYWRRHQDRFELFRDNPASWYTGHNYHLTDVMGVDASTSFTSNYGISLFGVDFRYDKILSNKLGEDMGETMEVPGEPDGLFTKSTHRENINAFIDHKIQLNKLDISGGIMTAWNSAYSWLFYPGVDLSYKLSNTLNLFASANKSLRLPTYTELYYADPVNIGNKNVKPEEATTFEVGIKAKNEYFSNKLTFFNRLGKNTIDWVKNPDSLVWEVMNISKINTVGVEFDGKVLMRKIISEKFPINYISYGYSYITQSKQTEELISKYALDYLKHKIFLGLNAEFCKKIGLNVNGTFQKREGTYSDLTNVEVPYPSIVLLDASVSYKTKFFSVFVECSNILNEQYNDVGGVLMPGRWFKTGISTNIPF